VAASGDRNSFSCWRSPGSSDFVLTVSGVQKNSNLPLIGSNYGDCVDVSFPGEDIYSALPDAQNMDLSLPPPLTGSSAATALATSISSIAMSIIAINSTLTTALFALQPDERSSFFKALFTSPDVPDPNSNAHSDPFYRCIVRSTDSIIHHINFDLKLTVQPKKIAAFSRVKESFKKVQLQKKISQFEDSDVDVISLDGSDVEQKSKL
jgi:hypothetical protein